MYTRMHRYVEVRGQFGMVPLVPSTFLVDFNTMALLGEGRQWAELEEVGHSPGRKDY